MRSWNASFLIGTVDIVGNYTFQVVDLVVILCEVRKVRLKTAVELCPDYFEF